MNVTELDASTGKLTVRPATPAELTEWQTAATAARAAEQAAAAQPDPIEVLLVEVDKATTLAAVKKALRDRLPDAIRLGRSR